MKTKRLLALVISLCMIFSVMPGISLTAFAEDIVTIALDANGIPTASSGTGWTYAADTNTLTLTYGNSYAVDGECQAIVNNSGTIVGGTYNNTVNNIGDGDTTYKEAIAVIDDGVFNSAVINGDGYDVCTINNGTFNGDVTNKNRGVVNGGTFAAGFTAIFGSNVYGGSFVIEFVTNGGVWADGYTAPTTYSYADGLTLPTEENISNGDLVFDGWYDNSDCTGLPVTTLSAETSGKLTFYANFVDGIPTWAQAGEEAEEGTDYAVDENGNYTVYTAKGLAKLANIVNGGNNLSGKTVTMANDIDLLDGGVYNYAAATVTERNTWIPIDGFMGTFDGNSKKLENLYVLATNSDAGLFGSNAGEIKNLELASGKVTLNLTSSGSSEVHAGAVAATSSGLIDNCINRVPVYVNDTAGYADVHVGGIVGLVSTSTAERTVSTVSNSSNYAEISSLGASSCNIYGGGIAGMHYSGLITGRTSLIDNCYNDGVINITPGNISYAGGIAGCVRGHSNTSIYAKLINSKNDGAVSGTHAGGIAGYNRNVTFIYNNYNTASVTGITNAGGIVGLNYYANSSVANCYNTGAVSGATNNGGIVGNFSNGAVSDCYYLATTASDVYGKIASGKSVTDCASFTSTDGAHTLSSEVNSTTDLLTALNSWVTEADSAEYMSWQADADNENYPKLARTVFTLDFSAPCDEATTATFDVTSLFPEGTIVNSSSPSLPNILSNCSITHPSEVSGTVKIEITTREYEEPTSGQFEVVFNTNYGDFKIIINITLTGQYNVDVSGIYAMDALYDGSVKYGYIGAPVGTLTTSGASYKGGWNVAYADSEGEVLASAPTEAGEYTVTFSVSDTENYKGSETYSFNIISEAEAIYQAEENGEWLNAAFSEAVEKSYAGGTVKLVKDINIKSEKVFANNVTITSNDAENPVTITTDVDAHYYLLNVTADVVMENVIVDGGSENNLTATRALIEINNSAKLTLNEGAIIRNNNNTTENGAGGGVCVKLGELVIDGGAITNNVAYGGGGVAIMAADCKVDLISGEISSNKSTRPKEIGGGGGVYISNGTFTMTGGSIKNNTAVRYGGGIYTNSSETAVVEIKGGSVTGNSAITGGGIFIQSYAKLNVSGGSVAGNNATNFAGGVECSPFSVITVTGNPVITGNTSGEEKDGGLYPDGYPGYGFPDIYVGELTDGADINFYTWLESEGFEIASPVEGYTITDSDMAKMSYESSTYKLKKDDSGNVILATGVNVTVDGESVVTDGYIVLGIDNQDGTYSLPEGVIGYCIDDDFVDAGKYAVTGGEIITTVNFNVTMVNGAQVRYGAGLDENGKIKEGNGLRFLATVNRNGEPEGAVYGMKITADGSTAYTEVNAEKWQNETTFSVAITDMAESNYIRKFTATPYVKVKYSDGTEKTIYGTVTVTRSIYQVAAGILKDETQTGYGLNDVLNAYANQTGIRLVVVDGELKANTSYTTNGAYNLTEDELHFVVSDAEYDAAGNKYSVVLTAQGNAEIITDSNFWYDYIRINNNNSSIKDKVTVEKVEGNDKAVKVTFSADGLIERPADTNDNKTTDVGTEGFDGETETFNK